MLTDGECSMPRTIKKGVPQECVEGPDLFECYLVPLEPLLECPGFNHHFLAVDIVICFVYHASLNQGAFDLTHTILRKSFNGA